MAVSGPRSRPARRGGFDREGGGVGVAQAYNHAARERLSDVQRARIVGAMFDVVAQLGAPNVTVAHVMARSGMSRRTFYENFEDREDCLFASFERALALVSRRVIPAYMSEKCWRERVRAGLVALLSFCDEQPSAALMLVCESQSSGPRVARLRTEVLDRLTLVVAEGRNEGRAGSVSSVAAEGIVGGVLMVIQARLTEAKRRPLVALTGELMSMIVLPYLGAGAARRELGRSIPKLSSEAIERIPLGDPFKEAGLRFTYRTVRVLMAIAEHPGASNRLVADTAEIADQGQISKLLGRLKRAGMLTNTGLGAGTGAPNAWMLTENGERIAQRIRASTEGGQSGTGRER